MATSIERVPLDRISDRARDIDARRLLMQAAAVPLMAVGFVAAVLWALVSWVCAAVLVGWGSGRELTGRQADAPTDVRAVRRGG